MKSDKKQKKELEGTVVSNKMEGTVVVRVVFKLRHPMYGKIVTRTRRYKAHTDKPVEQGKTVRIREAKRISKDTAWVII